MGTIERILANNIKNNRKRLGYSQENLAEKSKISIQTINAVEQCRRWVSNTTLAKISKALGIHDYELFLPDSYEAVSNVHDSGRLQIFKQDLMKQMEAFLDKQFADYIKHTKAVKK